MWQMAENFILRSAGFPAEWMDGLAFTGTAAAIDVALDAGDTVEELAQTLLTALALVWGARRDSGLRWKTLQKKLQQRQRIEAAELATCADDAHLHARLTAWNEATAAHAAARASAERLFETE